VPPPRPGPKTTTVYTGIQASMILIYYCGPEKLKAKHFDM